MERRLMTIAVFVLVVLVVVAAFMLTVRLLHEPGLARDGAFGFPQARAAVLFDDPDLRVSWANDDQHLYVQAILWNDADDALGETQDGRTIGDRSYLHVDADADGAITRDVDRVYSVNLWPHRQGLHYQVHRGEDRRTLPRDDSQGRGSIRYVDAGDGTVARVDSLLIPLSEIGRTPGDAVRLAYWGRSESPELILNSLGMPDVDPYGGRTMPHERYHAITLAQGQASIVPVLTPRGRDDAPPIPLKPKQPLPPVGAAPPELTAADWMNATGPQTLAALRGQVALVDFFTTNCNACVKLVPHLNELQKRHGPQGLRVVAFTKQSRQGIEWYLQNRALEIGYPIGTGSDLEAEYGVPSLPYAYLVGRDGRLLWHGRPTPQDLDARVRSALESP